MQKTKKLSHLLLWFNIVRSLRDREVACSVSDRQGSNFESCIWEQCHLTHLTNLAYMCTKVSSSPIHFILFYLLLWMLNYQIVSHAKLEYPVWLGHLTHLLCEAQSHWPPFCFHSQLCKNDTRAAYQKTRMSWNWEEYFKCLRKLGHIQQA